jgi:hypothetical protein
MGSKSPRGQSIVLEQTERLRPARGAPPDRAVAAASWAAQIAEAEPFAGDAELQADGSLREVRVTDTLTPRVEPAAARPVIIRSVISQLGQAVSLNLAERPVELSLEPAELGRVRLTLSATEGGFNINVLAERPETLDLMRRNAEALAAEYRALGYASVNLSFGQAGDGRGFEDGGAQHQKGHDEARPQDDTGAIPGGRADVPALHLALAASDRLDIRL